MASSVSTCQQEGNNEGKCVILTLAVRAHWDFVANGQQ